MKNPFTIIKLYKDYSNIKDSIKVKGWYASKTVIYNGLWLLVSISALIGWVLPITEEEVKQIAESFSIIIPIMLTVVDKCINIWLRFKTNKPIGNSTVVEKIE